MTDLSPVSELLVRWEQSRAAGRPIAAEDLCHDRPELLPEVQRRIAVLDAMLGGLDTVPPTVTPTDGPAMTPTLVRGPGDEAPPGYTLVKPLGRGGFGEVWQANAPGGMPAALKFVPWAGAVGEKERRSLDLLRNLRHPHLLATTAYWHRGDFLVLALELADGSLADRFEEARAAGLPGIPPDELLRYMAGAAEGLDYLNRPAKDGGTGLGVQHRDIKPQNLLRVGGEVKVADFGVARLLSGVSTGHTGAMTAAFSPPEFFRGETSRHSDQYSLAVTYCLLRGGRLPFTGGNPAVVMAGHLEQSPDLSLLPIPERPAVARALAKRPGDRWSNCRALVAELSRCVEPFPTVLNAKRPSPEGLRRARIIVGGVLAAIGATVIFWRIPKQLGANDPVPMAGLEQSPRPSEQAPSPAAVAYQRGMDLRARGNTKDARQAFDEALRLNPDSVEAYLARAETWVAERNLRFALADLAEALRRRPDAKAYIFRNELYYRLKSYEAAIADCNAAIGINSRFWLAYAHRAISYLKTHKDADALKDAITATENDGQCALGWFCRGMVKDHQHHWDQAMADYDHAISVDPKFVVAYVARGNLHRANRRFDKALVEYNKAIEIDPTMANCYTNAYAERAKVFDLLRKPDRARKDRETAKSLED